MSEWPIRPKRTEAGLAESLADADERREQLRLVRALYRKYGSYEAALNAVVRRQWIKRQQKAH